MSYQWLTLWSYGETFLAAAWLTLQVTLLAFMLAVALGLLAALAKASAAAPLRWLSHCYVEFIRNTPVLLQIFIIFFGLPSLGITMSAFTAGVLALGINVGAYLSETFRAGIQSVPQGQREAAWILGISRRQVFLSVVLPQAARAVWPAIINNLIQLLLGTSLLSAIALPELTGTATVINARTLLYIQTFSVVALVYLLLSNLFSWLGNLVGSRLFHPQLVAPVKKSARWWARKWLTNPLNRENAL
ncbi:amino acid ABC transporter permease [Phytobacter ursingii]|uniref:amino acid ABC transporter permease n=1 Tax=Phytobacter ursingii TaxID=1972431 RepID=UPI000CD185EE|nr:amino acid ABC transporter permease [Enterobacteriaceae bacterium ENNIH1]RDT52334.1 amino acid ABC transporter permease [Escherichia coli]